MRKKALYWVVTALLLTLVGCTGNDRHSADGKDGLQDTLYTEAAAMSIHLNNPDRAMVLIDSAVAVGNITKMRGQYLKGITQYGGYNNYSLARQTCQEILKNPVLKTHADSQTIENVYTLLVGIEYMTENHAAMLRYATEAARLARAVDLPSDVGQMEGHIALVMAQEGKTDESVSRLQTTIDELWQMNTFNSMIASYNTAGHLQHILLDHKRYSEMVELCERTLKNVDEFVQHTDRFADTPEGFDPKEFEDFARGQILAFMTTAYARQATAIANEQEMGRGDLRSTTALRNQLLQKAREAETEMFKTKWSKTIDCDRMMTAAYHHLGEFQRFDEAMARLDASMADDDTISNNFITRLGLRSTAAQMRGRLSEAISYMNRVEVIRDSLDSRRQRDQLNELATVYHLQEEQLARQQAEADAHLMKIYVLFIAAALLAAIAFAAYFFYKRRETARKNRVLAREITEAIEYKDKYEALKHLMTTATTGGGEETEPSLPTDNISLTSLSDKDLFLYLYQVIMRDKLFLDPQLDRQTLVDRFSLPKERIGAAFAKGSSYKSLIDFLTDCRLLYAAKLLTERPDLSIAEVARNSGFPSLNTFGRNFKQKYAITPTQFREQQEQG